MLTGRNHERLSVVLLGVGTALLFLGYDIQAYIAESVIHSIHKERPKSISQYAGYYGQAMHYLAFAVGSLFTASLHRFISSKCSLVIVCVIFSFFYLGFFYINGFYYYLTQILMGLGYAMYNNAEGHYLAEHSSEKTLISNTGIETGVGHTSMVSAGLFFLVFNYFFADTVDETTSYRNFSLTFIQITYSALLALTVLAGVVFGLLPTKQQPDSIASKAESTDTSFPLQIKKLLTTVSNANVLLLAVTFFYQGFFTSFFLGVYPTTFSFTPSLKADVYIVGLYSLFLGIAEMSGFLVLRPLMQRYPKHKLLVSIVVHFLALFSAMAVMMCSVPNEATIRPATIQDLVFVPSRWVVCLSGFLLGLADYTITMARAVICQLAVPEARAEVFSLTRLFQSIAACLVLFISPHLTLWRWMLILGVGVTAGCATFAIVARRTAHHLVAPAKNTDDDVSISRF